MSEITVFPILVARAFKSGLIGEYNVWLVLKALDTDVSGRLLFQSVFSLLDDHLGMSQSSVYRAISNGNNIFWSRSKEYLYLNGVAKLHKNLGVNWMSKYGFLMPLSEITHNSLKHRKAVLFSTILGERSHPQSYAHLAELCGISRRTAIDYVKMSDFVMKAKNYVYVSPYENTQEVKEKMHQPSFQLINSSNKLHLVKQISNSYRLRLFKVATSKKVKHQLPKEEYRPTERKRNMMCKGIVEVDRFYGNWNSNSAPQNVMMWEEKGN